MKPAETQPAQGRNFASWQKLGMLLLLAVPAGAFVFASWRQHQPVRYVVPPDPEPIHIARQAFQQAEQAELYRSSVVAGQLRSITILENSIQVLERSTQPGADENPALERLRTELRARQATLEEVSVSDERANIGTSKPGSSAPNSHELSVKH